ncbi:hypothetical protein [Metabacillus halosaccharovorans]|uniref:hypothetical protein n=1 Tax=Metabacillus halosaccharovorans TaxID=930124 RepID=UPI001C1FFE0A|nr:hypothetical protein [Metabacillus halosaccharovorans]MBU7594492.1 hypothetical protein [Metabacillus halosaccharovorans]
MKIHSKTVSFFLVLLLLLSGCEEDKMTNQKFAVEITYKKGFPTEASPALSEFIQHYVTGSFDRELLNKNGNIDFFG